MLYITSDQVVPSIKYKNSLEAACPKCGKTIQINMQGSNFCVECWADVCVKVIERQVSQERIYHGC